MKLRYVEYKPRKIEAHAEKSCSLNEIDHDHLRKKVQKPHFIEKVTLAFNKKKEVKLPPLSEEQLRMVRKAFMGNPNEVLTSKFNLNITRRDLRTLNGLNWLNDNIINFYINLLMERGSKADKPKTYVTNTFFYQKLLTTGPESLKRWTKRVDIFSYEFLCVPIHLEVHWCIAIINLKERTIKYYDSMGNTNDQCLKALQMYLEFEYKDKKGQFFSTKNFVLESVEDIPQQKNGSDCRVFSCSFAEYITRKARIDFEQKNMPYLRKKMVVEILTGQLLIQ